GRSPQRLQASVRSADQVSRQNELALPEMAGGQAVSRLGGDEFVVILSEIASADAASGSRSGSPRASWSPCGWPTTRSP
ncbi:MAG: hypothetical protein ACXW3P_08930, partial [Rhodospirillales bacterium]